MIDTVLFDLDGTIYNYDTPDKIGLQAAFDYACPLLGLTPGELRAKIKTTNYEIVRELGKNNASIHNRLIRYQRVLENMVKPIHPIAMGMYHAYWDTFLEQMALEPGVLSLIDYLHSRDIYVGICTNLTSEIQFLKMERLGIWDYFDSFTTSEECGSEKPDEHIFLYSLAKAGSRPENSIFIGDNRSFDVFGPAKIGMKGIWYCPDPEIRTVTPKEIEQYTSTPSKKINPGTETRLNDGVGIIRDEFGEYPVIHTYEGEWCRALFDL
jgi:putative hydrolase of the HAD superfamily